MKRGAGARGALVFEARARRCAGGAPHCTRRPPPPSSCLGAGGGGQRAGRGTEGDTSRCIHSLALRKDGTVACWGRNEDGQAPPEGRTDGPFVAVSAGDYYSLALRLDGTVACWGDDRYSQASPYGLPGGPCVAVSASSDRSMALRKDGTVVCWGWGHVEWESP